MSESPAPRPRGGECFGGSSSYLQPEGERECHGYGQVRAYGSFFFILCVCICFYSFCKWTQWAVQNITMVTLKFPSACVWGGC